MVKSIAYNTSGLFLKMTAWFGDKRREKSNKSKPVNQTAKKISQHYSNHKIQSDNSNKDDNRNNDDNKNKITTATKMTTET